MNKRVKKKYFPTLCLESQLLSLSFKSSNCPFYVWEISKYAQSVIFSIKFHRSQWLHM